MFKNAFRLPFRLLGIPVYLDVTFLVILPVLAWLIGNQMEAFVELLELPIDAEPLLQGYMPYALGLAAALALFVSVVIHELGHAVTARIYGVETEKITLWLLGGMAHFKEMPKQRGAEAVVAVAGPITSFLVGFVCWLLLGFVPTEMGGLYFVVVYTLYMNVLLAIFNMIPAMPLDGGRVLRSLLALRMSHLRATQVSAGVSRFLAVALGIFGLLSFNIFLILVALFVYMAVTAETQYALFSETLQRFTVASLMTREVVTVEPEDTAEAVRARMMSEARLAYPVSVDGGSVVGEVHLNHLRDVPPGRTVAEVMGDAPGTVGVESGAQELFDRMIRDDEHRLLVVDEAGAVVGIVTKTDLVRALKVISVGG